MDNIDWINKQKEKSACDDLLTHSVSADRDTKCDQFDAGDVAGEICIGRKTLLFGDVVDVIPCDETKTRLEGDVLFVNERAFQSKDLRIKTIKTYLRKVSQLYVSTEVSKMGTAISLCPSKIEFKDVPSGWVRCALAKERILCLDYRVAQLPQELRTYVIAHGFAHFISLQHDEKFWAALASFVPQYDLRRRELERYNFLKEL